ncbi:MAG: hypothetical protein UIM53_08905, partial [Acutalibacteraceae bacterium]|nr:hypothetical protein [Acutalibacteraceae bacterium]
RYSGEDMDKMQQEAVRRMQEMQNRGRPLPPSEKKSVKMSPVPCPSETPEEQRCIENPKPKSSGKSQGFFDVLFQDKERSLILLLLLLLSTEKTDTGLILALVYLLI